MFSTIVTARIGAMPAQTAAGRGTHFAARSGMSSERKKKGGHDPHKKRQRMRAAEAQRHATETPDRPQRDLDE
jgi:hypothetical protein